jgi:hypothetical protein
MSNKASYIKANTSFLVSIFWFTFISGALTAVVFLFSAAIAFHARVANAEPPPTVIVFTPTASRLGQATSNFVQLVQDYRRTPTDEKLNSLLNAAQERRQLLTNVIVSDPSEVIKNAVPPGLLQNIPADLSNLVEQGVSLSGKIENIHFDNFKQGTTTNEYTLVNGNERVTLNFPGEGPKLLLSGSSVRVSGLRLANDLALAGTTTSDGFTVTTELQPGHTVRKMAIIKINFLDKTDPFSLDTAHSLIFTSSSSSNNYFLDASFGKLSFIGKIRPDGDTYGPFTITYNSSPCSSSAWMTAAINAATAAGNDMTGYNNIMLVMPGTPCTGGGFATVGGNPGYVWINGSGNFNNSIVTHEIGHNVGAHHSSSLYCTDAAGLPVTMGGSCTTWEYGDQFDIMGTGGSGSGSRHFNNFQKGRVNWLEAVNTQTVTASGRYTIAPIETASAGVQSLRIPVPGTTKFYYLEFRQPSGFDTFSSTSSVANGILIRLSPDYTVSAKPLLYDTTPGSANNFIDSALAVGRTFNDATSGISVTTVSVSPTGAVVDVMLTPVTVTCARANPVLTLSPVTGTGVAGTVIGYTLGVSNNDSIACPTSTFRITASALPVGWTVSPSSFSVSLAPSTTYYPALGTPNIKVTSPSTAQPGTYSFTETVVNSSAPTFMASATANYLIPVPDPYPPTVSISAPANGATLPSTGTVTITANASDVGSGMNSIALYVDATYLTSCFNATTCSYSWKITRKLSSGAHTIKAVAQDKAYPTGNSSTATISVVKP